MKERVTMKTVAEEAGVTQATVSMSLANHPRIPPETRERIQAIVKKLGYRPNPYISTLMRIRRQGRPLKDKPVIALVSAFDRPDEWRQSPISNVRQMYEGAMARAAVHGYRGEEFWLHQDGMSEDRFSEMLHARGIQGLLLGPPVDGARLPNLKWQYFAGVGLSVPSPSLTLTTVCSDHYFSSLQAMRESYRRGYRRPGIVLLKSHRDRFQGRWEAGFLVAPEFMDDLHLVRPFRLETWNDSQTSPLARWVETEKPDVILSPRADALLPWLQRHGFRVPADIGLVNLACAEPDDPISGIYQNGRLIGATAIDTLINMIERHECGLPPQANTLMIEGLWNEGKTLLPAPTA